MREKIKEIKKTESPPKVIKNLYNKEEIQDFLKLYCILIYSLCAELLQFTIIN